MTQPVYATAVSTTGRDSDVVLRWRLQMPEHLNAEEAPEVATVVVPWTLIKGLIPLLSELVASYENANGILPAPGFTGDSSG